MNIYGAHEGFNGFPDLLAEAGRTGWIVDTVNVRSEFGKDYTPWSNKGIAIIARLNWGYHPDGTLPHSSHYADFAKAANAFVSKTTGCTRWIIGNEMNLADERPGGASGEVITPALYGRAFEQAAAAIRATQPNAEIIVGAVAPYNDQTGDWLQYFQNVLAACPSAGGISLHTYTHGSDPALITSSVCMGAPYNHCHYEFQAYRDFMQVIPPHLRHLPVYITETDNDADRTQGGWKDENTGWVQAAYAEIDRWNHTPGAQQILCLALYRWPQIDHWYIDGKQGVIEDLRVAMRHDYQPVSNYQPPTTTPHPPSDMHTLAAVKLRKGAGLQAEVITTLPAQTCVSTTGRVQESDGMKWVEVADSKWAGWIAQALPNGTPLLADGKLDNGSTLLTNHWDRCIKFVLKWEGGYANNPNDPGGETKYGISKRQYPHLDIANLTVDQAKAIYHRDYWQASGADKLAWPLCLTHFDFAVNAGVARAKQTLTASGGDGSTELAEVFATYNQLREQFYRSINGFAYWGEMWLKRVKDTANV